MKIFLTGFPGCGKTFFGKAASSQLKLPFFDTDQLIEAESGNSIEEIFRKNGEDFFRKKETDVLKSLNSKRKGLIATGGGTPCFNDNMDWMNENGLTVYLEASAAFLYHRLVKEKKTRPLLAKLSDIELMIYITETLVTRTPFYNLAQLTIDAETCTPARFIAAIQKKSV
jgi:shikimate kinase